MQSDWRFFVDKQTADRHPEVACSAHRQSLKKHCSPPLTSKYIGIEAGLSYILPSICCDTSLIETSKYQEKHIFCHRHRHRFASGILIQRFSQSSSGSESSRPPSSHLLPVTKLLQVLHIRWGKRDQTPSPLRPSFSASLPMAPSFPARHVRLGSALAAVVVMFGRSFVNLPQAGEGIGRKQLFRGRDWCNVHVFRGRTHTHNRRRETRCGLSE